MDTPNSQRRALKTGPGPFLQNDATCLVKYYIQQYEDSGTKEKGHENSKGLNIFYIDNLSFYPKIIHYYWLHTG